MSKSVQDIWRDITAKAWEDADFRRRLEEDTPTVLEEHGLPVHDGVDYKVVADTETLRHLVLLRPAGDVSVARLDDGEPLTDENAGF